MFPQNAGRQISFLCLVRDLDEYHTSMLDICHGVENKTFIAFDLSTHFVPVV